MKVKITYTAKHENAARATLNALRAMYPVARVHYSQNGEIRIHNDTPRSSGTIVTGRVCYDAFVLDNKKSGIYYQSTT